MIPVIVVLDIGKTNKKIALYDRTGRLHKIFSEVFPSVPFKDVRIEQVEAIEKWFLKTLHEISHSWNVKAISITTHGAAAVCIGDDGLPAVPVLDYTTEVDASVHRRFFETVGDPTFLQEVTCTPEVLPLINVGKLLFYTKERFPDAFKKVAHILFYPQYFSYRLTGKIHADFTYAGCHTYLWNFTKNTWSSVCAKLGIQKLLPGTVEYPGTVAGFLTPAVAESTGLDSQTPVLVGVHDSNSSLIPYLISGDGDFLLNSTGTWCVAMHPEKNAIMKKEDIGNTVFFNLSVMNKPVKTAIFLGGLELETWMGILAIKHRRTDFPSFSPELIQSILHKRSDFILPGVVQGTGQFPSSFAALVSGGTLYTLADIKSGKVSPALLEDYEKTFAVLLLSLAIHSRFAFLRAGLMPGIPIFIEGKFRQNLGYTTLVASLFPENLTYTTGIDEATSLGAAILGWAAVESQPLSAMSSIAKFEKIPVDAITFIGLSDYTTIYNNSIQ